ncbi:hypothetical protein [Streptomyces glaucus]|uniref:Secreted protein n=1 Tax=Streptomyces glaucus TaxID=284029 RepID=A0ABN3JP35_9ACTN
MLSQVVLSLGIPFALRPLVLLTSRERLMDPLANRRPTTVAASVAATSATGLDAALLVPIFS